MAGRACRYNGTAKPNEEMTALAQSGEAVLFCPEALAGLKIPRPPAEIVGGDGFDVLNGKARVVNKNGEDITEEFIRGAERVLELVKKSDVSIVYMKERSPSCGVMQIYDGSFSDCVIHGCGVTAALLLRNGVAVRGL